MGAIQEVNGQRFGRLVVIEYVPFGKRRCRCDCGKEIVVMLSCLRNGNTKSCGCLSADATRERSTIHGMKKVPEYGVWQGMKDRCGNTHHKDYGRYGGRGIIVCERWAWSFAAFFEDMGERPTPKHMIERRENDGHYCKDNCYWATPIEQARNKSTNHLVPVNGRMVTLAEAEELTGIPQSTIRQRINLMGWTPEKAVSCPVRKTNVVVIDGEEMSVHEAARRVGLHPNTLMHRLKTGWNVAAALSAAPIKGQKAKV